MKYDDVWELYSQMDAPFGYGIEEEHFYMQVWARSEDHLYVIRFGEDGGRNYAYDLPVNRKVPQMLGSGCRLPDGIDSRYGWDELEDVFNTLDWHLSEPGYIKRLAKEHVGRAAYELEEAQKAVKLIESENDEFEE